MEGWLNLAPSLGLDSCYLGSLAPFFPPPLLLRWGGQAVGRRKRGMPPVSQRCICTTWPRIVPWTSASPTPASRGPPGLLLHRRLRRSAAEPRFCVSKEPPGAAGPSPPGFLRTGFLELAGCAGVMGTHSWVPRHWLCDRWNPHTESSPTRHTHTPPMPGHPQQNHTHRPLF